jgi:Rrf2 family protein
VLTRTGTIALRALVELARSPGQSLAGPALAARQGLPAPLLEQLLLQLRRAGLLAARRGRSGGYRLARAPEQLAVAEVLDAVAGRRQLQLREPRDDSAGDSSAAPHTAAAGDRLERQLQQRLNQAVERELAQLTIAELLYDQLSWEASLEPEGGLMLG